MSSVNLNEIFFPHHNRELKRIEDKQINFVHYTNAEKAFKIIINQEIWLRNVAVMNDFREFEHGKECLVKLLDGSEEGQALKNIFNVINPEVFDKVYSDFKNWGPYIKDDFYISCFSEYKNKDDDIGKLSMWRAYGGNAGVAIIFKHDFFKMLGNAQLDFSSVAYLRESQLKKAIANLTESISTHRNNIQNLPPSELGKYLFNIFRFSALCNKHKGFKEEKEWRLIATASILPENKLITQAIETIQGTPQNIVKVKLNEVSFDDKQFKDMIDKIIIGPCQFPFVTYKSVITALKSIGIQKPENIVYISDIPLRMNH
jgi:Protein of unknown function (DUF2971)